jgi:hypothetical protein
LFKGQLIVEGAGVCVLTTEGKVTDEFNFDSAGRCRAVNPVDLSYAAGWDRNTRTGREPWRQPHLRLTPLKGEPQTFYNWPPRTVGADKYRLVSDSSFRRLHFDDAGNLYAVGWSDGGNTVFERDVSDLDQRLPFKGLGFSLWGAGVGSFCHLLKLDLQKPAVLNKTIWTGYLRGKNVPSATWITNLRPATDGSLLLSGNTSYGHIQTGDALAPSPPPPGAYVAVLTEDWSSIRFSSVVPATGRVALHGEGDVWGIATGIVNGRHKAVFTGSAIAKDDHEGELPAPTRNPVQKEYGGGLSDGYVVVLDLGPIK